MGSWKFTITDWSNGTSVCPLAGIVVSMYGLMQNVEKVHGFGMVPGTRSRPALSVPLTRAVCCLHCGNGTVWLRVRTLSPTDHEGVRSTNGVRFQVTEAGFIGSLNVTTISAVKGTSICWNAGFVTVTVGFTLSVTKIHGSEGMPSQTPGVVVVVRGSPDRSRPWINSRYTWFSPNGCACWRSRTEAPPPPPEFHRTG